MSDEKTTLKQQIDSDEQLQKLGRRLSILSLLFLGVMLTGATIEEANTFVFKVKVTTQEGIPALFLLSTSYLMFRYYTYARPYQKVIDRYWLSRLERDPVIVLHDYEENETHGLVVDFQPKGVDLNCNQYSQQEEESWTFEYRISGIGRRCIRYSGGYVMAPHYRQFDVQIHENVKRSTYLRILLSEAKYQLTSFVEDKERLDLWGPYLVASLAILSFFYQPEFQQLVKSLVGGA